MKIFLSCSGGSFDIKDQYFRDAMIGSSYGTRVVVIS